MKIQVQKNEAAQCTSEKSKNPQNINETDKNIQDINKKDKNTRNVRLRIAMMLFVLSAGLMVISARFPVFSEWYSQNIYPILVSVTGRVMGLVPFSVAELGLYVLLTSFVVSAVRLFLNVRLGQGERQNKKGDTVEAKRLVKSQFKRRFKPAQQIYSWFSKVALAVAVLAFLYTVGCGINYHRKSFSETEGIYVAQYSARELKAICQWLTEEVNQRAGTVKREQNEVMTLTSPEGESTVAAMRNLSEQFASLKGYYPQPKKVIVSEILSYQGLTGVYSPFTVEANYNGDMTSYNVPFTACHELSHLRGFMQEEEANFIAFLACIESGNSEFEYSGYLSGWVYCMNALYRIDLESWQEIRGMLDERAEPDLQANSTFWQEYEGIVSEAADKVNDTYLKVNGHADGVQSYNRMVDLIVVYFKEDL